ncbi:LPS-assembly protein LptD [Paracoccus marinaquae]|uniref:LPS-assembly protein LptD n=1 Tax=Paracoccus marinaquae TaxID=2841926 RepID=A0ABS6AFH8_9RHOB|nr:LPS assembly protein LptD [Paracoccus marinaquae]MBU3028872.1 LPS assembly protein LptD [Paracoccus marinaquae]
MTPAGLKRLTRTAGLLTGLAAWTAAPLPALPQSLAGEGLSGPGMAGAPLTTTSGEAALAPAATRLDDLTFGDPGSSAPQLKTAAPDADVTLESRPAPGAEEDAATVLADTMILQGDRTLIAAGGVVIWYQGARLVASRLIVDGASGDLTIEGPIHLSRPGAINPDDEAVLIADSAQLDRKLQDGIIRGARLMIARELQLASEELVRTGGGRMTSLRQVAASSCQVCANDPTPLWEIRARNVTHDAETRLMTIDRPQLRAFGVPIAALPFTITAPDPTVERRSGFLRPEIRTTSNLGFGIKLPYFQTLGDHADLTFTPYVSASWTRTLELRYRQAWQGGAAEWNGAVTRDDIQPGETRGYIFANAVYELPRGYRMGLQLQMASDRGYLLDYDISDADRLWSGITLERVTRELLFFGRIGNYETLREDVDNETEPAQVADILWQRRFTPGLIGGMGVMEWSIHAQRRPSDQDAIGRDMARASLGLDWRRSEILPGGVVGAVIAGLDADIYRISQDRNYDDIVTRADPVVGVELRWPLMGSDGTGATHMVEPVAQILWSPPGQDDDIPNEDSRLIEFDEGNLFSANRFPGWDARENGLRANIGVTWTRIDPTGWSLGVTGGKVLRTREDEVFAADSPLTGRSSDWLLGAQFDSGTGLAIANRALFNESFVFSRNELRVGWIRPDLQLSAGYLWIDSDENEQRDDDTSELVANIGWQIAEGWWGVADTRYDFAANQAQEASLDLTYRNECLTVEMGLSRRFTETGDVRPETSFDLSVRLAGFGSQNEGPGTVARRSCMR